MKNTLIVLLLLICGAFSARAQSDEVPAIVKETFSKQYPGATSIHYEDRLLAVEVNFTKDNSRHWASYTRKGVWKSTEQEWSYEQLPAIVKDGFRKSKFAERQVEEVKIIYKPGGIKYYRLKTKKNDVQKKNLFFNEEGRLVDDSITL